MESILEGKTTASQEIHDLGARLHLIRRPPETLIAKVFCLMEDEGLLDTVWHAGKITLSQVLADAAKPGYFADPRVQMAWFGLADTQRGQNDVADAAENYVKAADQPNCSDWLRKRAQLNAGEMFDLLHQRKRAEQLYEMASAGGGDQSQADMARRLMKTPYAGR